MSRQINIPDTAGWCAWDADECWVMIAVDSEKEMSALIDQLQPRKRVRIADEEDAA